MLDYDTQRMWDFVERVKYVDKPLIEYEHDHDVDYKFFLLAVELLTSHAGEDALLRYFMLRKSGTSWLETFEIAFGMTVDEFYVLFEEHRAAGFPCLDCPPQTVDDYILWKVGDEVNPTAEAEARETVLAVHDYASDLGLSRLGSPITIFIHRNLDALAAEFEATTGRELENRAGPGFAAGRNSFANSSNWVAVNTSADRYQEWTAETRERQLGGHFSDALLLGMSDLPLWAPADRVPPGGPAWLREGSKRYITYQALRPSGPESCDPTRSRYARISESAGTRLSEAETSEDFWALENSSAHGFLGVELLAEQAGQESIMGYFASLSTGTPWQQAFEAAFGITVDQFYELFEERRAAGFPQPRCATLPPLVALPGSPEYVKWEIDPDVRPEDVEDVIEGTRLMHEYIESLDVPGIKEGFTVHLYRNQDELKTAYALTAEGGGGWVDQGGEGAAGKGYFFVNTLRWEERDRHSDLRKKISAHEVVHVLQTELVGVSYRSDDHSVPQIGPRWLREGIAEFLAYQALSAADVLSYDTKRNSTDPGGFVREGKYVDKPLPEMETRAGITAARGSTYKLFLLAAELLASGTGQSSLINYNTLLQPGTTWQQAFETAFGMPVDEFYELFEEHRAAGFPELDAPK